MQISSIILHVIQMPLKAPFTTHLGTVSEREGIIIEVIDEDAIRGFGEGVAFSSPWYTEETVKTSLHVIEDFLIPLILNIEISHPKELLSILEPIRGNNMAKSALETAVWDLYAKRSGQPLSRLLGGTSDRIPSGVVVATASIAEALSQIENNLAEGYRRFKVKIQPGRDVELISEIRRQYPDLPLMADANSAYSLSDVERLKALDEYNLMMIEQPLGFDDIIDHACLQKSIRTPICLDESIHSIEDARVAIELGSCKIINIKMGRVGGLTEAKRIHDYCQEKGIEVWAGGMIEFGISRAHNIALASLPGFTIPGDISSSSRFWEEDIILPEVIVENGYIKVPKEAGIGFDINQKRLREVTVLKKIYKN